MSNLFSDWNILVPDQFFFNLNTYFRSGYFSCHYYLTKSNKTLTIFHKMHVAKYFKGFLIHSHIFT